MTGFREFIARGNVLDLAVAVIIGAAFGGIVSSLTDDLIMPAIGAVFGGLDFSNYFIRLGPIPATFKGDPGSYEALKAAGVPMLGYGQFATAVNRTIPIVPIQSSLTSGLDRLASMTAAAASRGIASASSRPSHGTSVHQ